MTPYLWRLCCLSLAVLFVVQICAGLLVRLAAPRVLSLAERLDPAKAAALMLAFRWLPGVLGLFVALCLCVPAYLRLEPLSSDEEIGFACVCLGCLALLSYLIPVARVVSNVVRSEVRLRALVRDAEERAGLFVIRETSPAMALAGLFHSRVVVSREVERLLTADQMDAARRHEGAHRESLDNWKRLVLEGAPIDLSGRSLRSAWSRFTEWAADDKATEGEPARSVALASALVSVARLASADCLPHASMLVSDGRALRARVERLLAQTKRTPQPFPVAAVVSVALTLAALAVAIAQQPAGAAIVHQLLESLVE